MKVLFIGQNGPFTNVPLQAVAGEHEIVGLVESASRNYGIEDEQKNILKKWALKVYRKSKSNKTLKGIANSLTVPYFFLTRDNRQELVQFISDVDPDIICVASMSQLLKKEAYSLPKYGTINFHPALLPDYRGPNPWFWQYYYMEEETGATIHFIDDGEDTGDILKQGRTTVEPGMPPEELMNEVIQLGAKLMVEVLEEINNGVANPVQQRHLECLHRARNIDSKEKLIDWDNWPIERVWHVLRGTSLWLDTVPSKIPGLVWTIQGYSKSPSKPPWGKKSLSLRGWYLSHYEGRIKIYPHISIKSIAKAILS